LDEEGAMSEKAAAKVKGKVEVPRVRKILFPTEFSEDCYAALPWAQRMASLDGAAIHLLHVVPDVPVISEMGMYFSGGVFQQDVFMEAAEERLRIEKGRFQGEWQPVDLVVRLGDPATAIDDYARENDMDLIVMSTHQPGLLERLFKGSVAERTLREAPCPVLVVPSGEDWKG
jgi:nucleotide-binding universal stress UspA family protein